MNKKLRQGLNKIYWSLIDPYWFTNYYHFIITLRNHMTHGQSYKSHDTWTLIQITWYMDTHANHMTHGDSYISHDKGIHQCKQCNERIRFRHFW